MTLIKDITDKRFGSLTVLNLDYKKKSKWGSRTYWLCKCDCGNEKSVRKDHLTSGGTKSCGCLEKQNLENMKFKPTHGQTQTRLYYVWNSMRMRCKTPMQVIIQITEVEGSMSAKNGMTALNHSINGRLKMDIKKA